MPTRIAQTRATVQFDAIVLAAAGVERLRDGSTLDGALDGITVVRLDPQRFVPAPAQGALAVQCRLDDARVREALAALDHPASHAAVDAERDALRRAEGGCDVAFGAYFMHGDHDAGRRPGAIHELLGMHERAGRVRAARVRGTDPRKLGAELWAKLDGGLGDRDDGGSEGARGAAESCSRAARRIARNGPSRSRGAEPKPFHCPASTARRSTRRRCARRSVAALADADWLVFTSRRGVEAFAELSSSPLPAKARVAVVGAATADAARAQARPRGPNRPRHGAALAAQLATDGDLERRPNVLHRDRRERRRRAGASARGRRRALHAARPLSHDRRAAGGDQAACVDARCRARRAREPVGREWIRAPSGARRAGRDLHDRAVDHGRGARARIAVTAEAREPSLEGILEAMQ